MNDYKKIFFDILEELDISTSIKSFLLKEIFEINFDLHSEEGRPRHYLIELIVEERSIAALESEIRKLKRKKLISTLKRRLCSNSVKFKFTRKESYESTLKKVSEFKENLKKVRDQKEMEAKKERLLDQIDLERLAADPDWQETIKKNKKIKEGYIYILSNLELPRTYKIGFVKDDPDSRAKSLKSETGLETDFVIENLWWTKNPYEVEQKIFNSLHMQKNKDGEYYGESYRLIKEMNGKSFTEFVNGESLKFFCERIEKFIQD